MERATVLAELRKKKEAARRKREQARRARQAAAKRRKRLESLVGQEDRLWAAVAELIETRLPKSYDKAVSHLRDLRDLTEMRGKPKKTFKNQMARLQAEHRRKKTLLERFVKAQLIG